MQDEINAINIQTAFIGALLFAISLNLYASLGYKDLLINGQNSKFTQKKLYKIALLSANITLIVTIYFLILAYETYQKDKTNANFNYYMASVLSFSAQTIRLSTAIKYPGDLSGPEDVI